jgi:hypothetical protein
MFWVYLFIFLQKGKILEKRKFDLLFFFFEEILTFKTKCDREKEKNKFNQKKIKNDVSIVHQISSLRPISFLLRAGSFFSPKVSRNRSLSTD